MLYATVSEVVTWIFPCMHLVICGTRVIFTHAYNACMLKVPVFDNARALGGVMIQVGVG